MLAGLVAILVLSLGTDAMLRAVGLFPPWGQPMADALFVVASLYRGLYAVVGCALTARLAPARPMHHALALGGLGVIVTSLGAVAKWNAGPEFGPHWYPLTLIATSLPLARAGGRLQELRSRAINPSPEVK